MRKLQGEILLDRNNYFANSLNRDDHRDDTSIYFSFYKVSL